MPSTAKTIDKQKQTKTKLNTAKNTNTRINKYYNSGTQPHINTNPHTSTHTHKSTNKEKERKIHEQIQFKTKKTNENRPRGSALRQCRSAT